MAGSNEQDPSFRDASEETDLDLGGADTVPKTTYVRGAGTEPEASSDGPIAAVPSQGAPATLLALLVAIAMVAAVVYLVALAG